MVQIYTLGYEKRSIEEFVELLLDAKIDVLVDVREKAWSHKPGFSKTAFTLALENVGIEYVHAPFAGNPKTIRARANSHEACLEQYRRYLERRPEIIDLRRADEAARLLARSGLMGSRNQPMRVDR